ncbi:MAG: VWA domain-containing protein [Planctomycetaceae bacterium]|nr:VWA domain-containing protein [Planctomycetaceae bacterium]
MSWLSFYSLPAAYFLLLLIPLILFYFLKLRRPQVRISSLVLWQQVLNDQRVNSPFQKFKRNLLLLLQILMLLSLILALMQPFIPSGVARMRYLPILIDTSASMGSLDKPGGTTRLDEAKDRIRKIIDNLLPDQRVSLIAMSSTAKTLVDFTNNRKQLHTVLDRVEVEPKGSKPVDALRMAQALGRTYPITNVVIFSDGNIPERIDMELPFNVDYQKLPEGGGNLGIAGINARRKQNGWEIFTRVESGKGATTSGVIELLVDGQKVSEEKVALDPNEGQRLAFLIETTEAASIECRLRPDGFDALEVDNVAYLELPRQRPLVVACSDDLATFRRALKTYSQMEIISQGDGSGEARRVDCLISEVPQQTGIDALVNLYMGFVPEDLSGLITIDQKLAEVVDWQRNAQLLMHVNMNEVQITDQPTSAPGVTEKDFEKLGYEVLAHGKTGPLILVRDREGFLDYYLLFHPDRSTLPYRVGFPVLVNNLIEVALERAGLSEIRGSTTGSLPLRQVEANKEYAIIGPDGSRETAQSGGDGLLSGIAAEKVGRYRIEQGGTQVASVGISLIQPLETSMKTVEDLEFPEVTVESSVDLLKSDTPIWHWLVLFGFAMLIVEWWYFHRRPVVVR